MNLSTFVFENLEAILREWEEFARSILPATRGMSAERLRDHAKEMLIAIAKDIQTAQSASEQQDKSAGRRRRSKVADSPAETHTLIRLADGFTLNEVVSEYRALRASVIRLWTSTVGQADRTHLDELTRFNEAIDEALCESIARYTQRIDRARDLLLGALGHDLRNPLGAILQSAHFLLRAEALEGAHTKAVARILNSGTRMKDMISDLLDFASTRLGDLLPVTRARMDLGEACRAALEEMVAFHPDRNVELDARGDLSGFWDPARIAQMLSNLLGNAVEHGAAEGPIRLSAVGLEREVQIEVHNEGPAIPECLGRGLFEPLARGAVEGQKNPNGNRNIGLGLYIACEIAKAHGGMLELARSDHEGTVFAARLPRSA
jgi:signal transduction histidine kinase